VEGGLGAGGVGAGYPSILEGVVGDNDVWAHFLDDISDLLDEFFPQQEYVVFVVEEAHVFNAQDLARREDLLPFDVHEFPDRLGSQ
jgi:hypothetical protein